MYLPEFLRKGFSEPRIGIASKRFPKGVARLLDRTRDQVDPFGAFPDSTTAENAPAPALAEMGAYEALWLRPGATFKTVGEWLRAAEGGRASALVDEAEAARAAREVRRRFTETSTTDARIKLHGEADFPAKLGDARHPLRAFYYRGDLSLLNTPSVAVVGARQLSEQGAARTRRLVRRLVEDGFTIVSGMAAGTDAVAHATALAMGGRTIAVLGTPIHKVYPRQNAGLQDVVAERFLVVSQVPVLLYESKDWRYNRKFFPERNVTMSALTDASIIVEIGDSNGTFIQSKAALDQGRPLFLLNNCFRKKGVSWPAQFAHRGAVRATDYEDIGSRIRHLAEGAAILSSSSSGKVKGRRAEHS